MRKGRSSAIDGVLRDERVDLFKVGPRKTAIVTR